MRTRLSFGLMAVLMALPTIAISFSFGAPPLRAEVRPGAAGNLPAGTEVLTRLDKQLGAVFPPFPAMLPVAVAGLALAAATSVFQTMHAVHLDSSLNALATPPTPTWPVISGVVGISPSAMWRRVAANSSGV